MRICTNRWALALALWAMLFGRAMAAPSAGPEPSVSIEIVAPAANHALMPGESVEVTARVTDSQDLVRRVFVRLATATGTTINADQDARKDGGVYRLVVRVPLSARPGRYLVQVQAVGAEHPLKWATVPLEVRGVRFGVKVLAPAPETSLSRNETFDVVAQVDDPQRKARRVFVEFEDVQRRLVLNANRDATRKGDIWSLRLQVPPTVAPGRYGVNVRVHGEGFELLGATRVPLLVATAPVGARDFQLDRESGVRPGETVRASGRVEDARGVVRRVLLVCTGPDGKRLPPITIEPVSGAWTRDIPIDMDAPGGLYLVEMQVVGQQGEVLASRRTRFTVISSERP